MRLASRRSSSMSASTRVVLKVRHVTYGNTPSPAPSSIIQMPAFEGEGREAETVAVASPANGSAVTSRELGGWDGSDRQQEVGVPALLAGRHGKRDVRLGRRAVEGVPLQRLER